MQDALLSQAWQGYQKENECLLLCVSTVCVGVKMTWMGSTMKATMLGLLFNLDSRAAKSLYGIISKPGM